MPEQTLGELIQESHRATIALTELIEREYPTRKEAERKFATKEESRKRLTTGLTILALLIPLSFFGTFTTLSICFLKVGQDAGPEVCNIIPGYRESQERNKIIFKQFNDLREGQVDNRRRIKRLEGQQ